LRIDCKDAGEGLKVDRGARFLDDKAERACCEGLIELELERYDEGYAS